MRTSLLASSLIVFATLANPAHALFGDDEARRAIVELRANADPAGNANAAVRAH